MGIAQRLEEAKRKTDTKPEKKEPKTEETKKAETVLPSEETPREAATEKLSVESPQSDIQNLPSQKEKLRSEFSKKLELHMENLQEAIFRATRALNDVTGYSGIEKLKKSVDSLEAELKKQKQTVKDCKVRYSEAIQKRSDSQKEINELLTRKHNWSPVDVERFTELYRNDHTNQQEESQAEQELADAESAVDSVQNKLTQSILTRYHEEQIWSDKIRQASTWGTWIIMGVNVLLFTVATFLVEPWKRRRLVNAFDAQVQQKMDSFANDMRALAGAPPVQKQLPIENAVQGEGEQHTIAFSGISSWEQFKNWLNTNYEAVKNTSSTFSFGHQDFTIYSAIILGLGSLLGSAFTLLFRAYIK
ncbi:hypothetical protein FT663_03884 [Candidozyma haemuli var. vulneris]|uniref:Sensitive to high expression protein 9, mitochondrial n=1 Tax=Candidozyma haemuli TaxID=45357 RepID=A0A2V1ANZ5_9ASCO|nr:hypothetical protein CXQ85_001582 [[Candida] haemuloni]KAF3987565.1 hypothetical protein FT662_03936 [[Candida] haemuloni var. vulneris]KAF3988845.1 hypothetical protein FT663_03884 [[Candida] haemuloni var. vulneris]PVH19276.1 hypothetical protein CXQ85_001582 [[Candida] haemuloni]